MTSRAAIGAALLVLALSTAGVAEPRSYVLDPARSALRFRAVSRLVDADGVFRRFAGELRLEPGRLETVSGRIVVEVASIDTANRRRDDHLRSADFFDAARYPEAVFVVTGLRPDGAGAVVSGELTIRGVTRPLAVPVTLTMAGDAARAVGGFVVNRREFGVAYQSWLNPVGDQVTVSFDLTAVPR